jgi:hypothetical protein
MQVTRYVRGRQGDCQYRPSFAPCQSAQVMASISPGCAKSPMWVGPPGDNATARVRQAWTQCHLASFNLVPACRGCSWLLGCHDRGEAVNPRGPEKCA